MTDLVLIASVAGQRVAFDAGLIESVIDLDVSTAVPMAPPHIIGLAAARSRVLTVIDAGLALGGEAATGRRAVVIVHEGHRYALRVDAVEEVAVPKARLDTDAPAGSIWRKATLATLEMPSGFVLLLDPSRVISGRSLAAA